MVALQGGSGVLIGNSGVQVASALSQHTAYVGIRRRRRFRAALNSVRHTVRKGRRIASITRLPLLNVLQQAAVCRVLPAHVVHGQVALLLRRSRRRCSFLLRRGPRCGGALRFIKMAPIQLLYSFRRAGRVFLVRACCRFAIACSEIRPIQFLCHITPPTLPAYGSILPAAWCLSCQNTDYTVGTLCLRCLVRPAFESNASNRQNWGHCLNRQR